MASAGRSGQPRIGWGFFGTELKRCREAAGLTQQELGRRVFCSGGYIGQFETGIRKPQLDVALRIDAELRTGGFFERMWRELINKSPYADSFSETAYLETLAATIMEYAPTYVPGVLQTAAYARAVFLGGLPLAPEDEIQARVAARLARARILDDPAKPSFWSVLDEGVIRRKIGGAAVMHEQLKHVIALIRKRRIGVQVMPFGAGAPVVDGSLTLMTFEDAPPVAYSEGYRTGSLLDDPATVAWCERAYDLARAVALSPEASVDLIESVAEEYADECSK
ncbi:helix-turn-helix domain-containing protein [Streptomyces sp. NPDC001262]|uniref:helix-turn-helix domain-containing protein n=1 Tax=unclassified Streptomyces TaxID=2593676 RepID=UPI0036A30304